MTSLNADNADNKDTNRSFSTDTTTARMCARYASCQRNIIENVPPAVSPKTNVVNNNDVYDVSPQHSIQTFSGLRNLLTRHSGSKIGCLNIRGLLNKMDEMRTIVTECTFDIMGICEMFLDDNVADNEICIEGYTIVNKKRNRHGGGVILYIKEGIQRQY